MGLICFKDKIEKYLPARSQGEQLGYILRTIEQTAWQKETEAREVLLGLASRLPPKGVIFLFTDGFDLDESSSSGYFAELVGSIKKRGYQVILLHILDPSELEFPFDELSLFEGLRVKNQLRLTLMA